MRLEVCFPVLFATFAVDHDPNASLSCASTWKPLNCRLNCRLNCNKVDLYGLNAARVERPAKDLQSCLRLFGQLERYIYGTFMLYE